MSTGSLPAYPQPFRDIALRHSELIKFAIVGGTTFLIDSGIFYTLKLSILESKPITAKIIARRRRGDRVVHSQPRVVVQEPWWP